MTTIDWPTISREYGPVVWRTVYRIVGRGADASDCFQETFVSALDVARRGPVRNWPGLLQRLATARALDQLRKRGRERLRRGTVPDWDEVAGERQALPERRAVEAELMGELREALSDLPGTQAEVFCLRHLNELSYEEIAKEMGMTVDNVGVQLHRARGRLRELLAERSVCRESSES